jgi:predicted lysophospholipase L1 biosynthesis ABC-type transport system permease subunit
MKTAAAELAAISTSLDTSHPTRSFRPGDGALVVTRRQWSARDVVAAARPSTGASIDGLLIGMTLLALLVACTNLANLMLSRGALRLHELAVRRALGASRWRLVREFLAESVWITLLGAACTFILTRTFLLAATVEIPTPHSPITIEPELNLSALLFTSALLASAIVFGLEPALNLTRKTLNLQLASEAGAAPVSTGRRQRSLIRWQVAISGCFFIVTAVLAKVVVAEARNDTGIALDRLAVTTLHFGLQGWDESRARPALDRALAIARRHPEIAAVTVSSGLPFGLMTQGAEITTPDRPFRKGARAAQSVVLAGSPELLRTLDVPLLKGRNLDARDEQTDVDTVMSRDDHLIYVPYAQRYLPNVALVARTAKNPAVAVSILQAALREAAPDLPAGTSGPAYWLAAGPYVAARIAASLAGALGALTLILAMVGLYGVQAQAVAHRTREVGVRMALGADAGQIGRMVLREGFRPVVQGLLIGLVLGILTRAGIGALLFARVAIIDPFALAVVPVPLAIAAFLACYLPARRAARVEPTVALRHL